MTTTTAPATWVSIDPSKKAIGIAVWEGTLLVATFLARPLKTGVRFTLRTRAGVTPETPKGQDEETFWAHVLKPVELVVMEGAPQFTRGAKGAISMGWVRGYLAGLAVANGVRKRRVVEVAVEAWRKVLGYPSSRVGRERLKAVSMEKVRGYAERHGIHWLGGVSEDEAEAVLIGRAHAREQGWV